MYVGLLSLELYLPEAYSLKSKRFILKSLKDRIKNKFNVSVAEVDYMDLWQRSVIGIACVGNETKIINQTLDKILALVQNTASIDFIDSKMEIL
ncbi:MAG TPA: DUF503 domain-containing protein [Thermodesulfovibrionia bacterium]|nr:DUF503 domain-containing protein [Thermodesulfovibrionia bacterium]